jgi:hypothetical protein
MDSPQTFTVPDIHFRSTRFMKRVPILRSTATRVLFYTWGASYTLWREKCTFRPPPASPFSVARVEFLCHGSARLGDYALCGCACAAIASVKARLLNRHGACSVQNRFFSLPVWIFHGRPLTLGDLEAKSQSQRALLEECSGGAAGWDGGGVGTLLGTSPR